MEKKSNYKSAEIYKAALRRSKDKYVEENLSTKNSILHFFALVYYYSENLDVITIQDDKNMSFLF